MMSAELNLHEYLASLKLGGWEYHPVIGSTNDRALQWACQGATDWSLVIADMQTAGRGRAGRTWVTKPGAALAFSLVLRPMQKESAYISRFSALAALGLVQALEKLGLSAQVKWPNDILLEAKKVGGVLVEIEWQSDVPEAVILGLGVNIAPGALPAVEMLRYPATSIEDALGEPVDRWGVLADTLTAMHEIREKLPQDDFLALWNAELAFRGQWIMFSMPGENPKKLRLMGVNADGSLNLENRVGESIEAVQGEIVLTQGAEEFR